MRSEVVHDDNVAMLQRRHELLLNVGEKDRSVDRPIHDERGGQGSTAKRGQKSRRFPVTVRNMGNQASAFRRTPSEPRHVRFRPGFVDENQMLWVQIQLLGSPFFPLLGDVGTVLFRGDQDFFLKVNFSSRKARDRV